MRALNPKPKRPPRQPDVKHVRSLEVVSVTQLNGNIAGHVRRANRQGIALEVRVHDRTMGWFVPCRRADSLHPTPAKVKRGEGKTTTTLRPIPENLVRPFQMPSPDFHAE